MHESVGTVHVKHIYEIAKVHPSHMTSTCKDRERASVLWEG